jgi:hypothetical protein
MAGFRPPTREREDQSDVGELQRRPLHVHFYFFVFVFVFLLLVFILVWKKDRFGSVHRRRDEQG